MTTLSWLVFVPLVVLAAGAWTTVVGGLLELDAAERHFGTCDKIRLTNTSMNIVSQALSLIAGVIAVLHLPSVDSWAVTAGEVRPAIWLTVALSAAYFLLLAWAAWSDREARLRAQHDA